jgi:molybdenum cofactor guanylyltransferase
VTSPRGARCGVLLAGGLSTRFGGAPKGLEPLANRRLADFPLAALTAVCDDVVIAANDPTADTWFPGHTVIADGGTERSALAGLLAALRIANGRLLAVCAWDLPLIPASLLQELVTVVASGASACVPQHSDGRLEPLCAAYDGTCLPVAAALMQMGERAAQHVVREAGGVFWPVPTEYAHTFFNVNTRDDLPLAERWMSSSLSTS